MTARFYHAMRHVTLLCGHSCHQFPRRHCTYALFGILLSSLLLLSVPVTSYAQEDSSAEEAEPTRAIEIVDGYEYAVQPGETWSLVSSRTGVAVSALQEANPAPTRRGYLREGERLSVPVRIATTIHVVQRGESWSIVAQDYGISQQLLRAFNPVANRYGDVLRLNDTLTIPLPDEPLPTVAPDVEAADDAVADEVQSEEAGAEETGAEETDTGADTPPAADETATATPNEEEAATDEAVVTSEAAQATATPAAVATPLPACPTNAEAYPALLLELLNRTGGDAEIISTLLTECGVMAEGSVSTRDFTGDGVDDFVIVYADPATSNTTDASGENTTPRMDLLIIDSTATGGNSYRIGHQARAESAVQLLSTVDINSDGQSDVVWAETTCGADDCFQTFQVYSWDGTAWQNWTASRVTLANADLALEDIDARGSGFELILEGGIHEGPDAGPQRSTVSIWGSIDGAPYTVLDTQVAASDCLYHAVIDGNAAFLNGAVDNFTTAEEFYSPAVADNTLKACGNRPDEITELRSFSIFRLALIAAYRGQPTIAADLITGLSGSFPESIYHDVGQIWLNEYQSSYDIASACAAVTAFAEAHPEAVAVLADYGYANPTFAAADICPILDIEVSLPSIPPTVGVPADEATAVEPAEAAGNTEDAAAEDTPATTETLSETTTAETPTTVAEETADIEASVVTTATEATEVTDAEIVDAETADTEPTPLPAMDDGLPTCPENLAGYAAGLTTLLDVAAGDPLIIETWLRFCDAMNDEAEAFVLDDLNGDGQADALFLPTIISDRGVGPEGAQGAVLLYHGTADGGYELAANPQIYGKPSLLAVEDLNADGQTDIAWTVEGCATFCVSEVQIVSWQNEVYTDTIAPGALIAEGTATFTDLPADSAAQGKQLLLEGGVSGTPDGGLAVPHAEVWQSIDGAPFERVSWTYNRQVEGNECMGLRLVEADVAMQAAPLVGYEPAIERYTASIDPSLAACSLHGTAAEEELQLLQGLATFRLIQAHALSGDLDTANEILGGIVRGLPDSDYTQAAEAWLTAYTAGADAAAACDEVTEIFVDNKDLWQITDHYGYNHPALAAEQICYVPES